MGADDLGPPALTLEAAVDLADVPLVSADAHVDEPHDLWFDRLPGRLRDRAPRRISTDEDGGWTLVLDGSPLGWVGTNPADAEREERARWSDATPAHRLAVMREDTVNAEIIYPTIGLYVWNLTERELGRRCCQIYNDWIADQLVGQSDRIRCAGMLPIWDVEDTIAEAGRLADLGFAAHMLPLVGTPEWNSIEWNPLWDALDELGMPVTMHQGSGHDMIFYRGWGSSTANLLATQSMAPRAAALLSCGGILESHPTLHVVFVEVNASWLAWAMSTLDEYHEAHAGWAKPKLQNPPSHYIKRQIHATFQTDPVALHNLDYTGSDCLMWGNDYPHPEDLFPNSRRIIMQNFEDVSIGTARKLLGETAVTVLAFDPAVLDSRA